MTSASRHADQLRAVEPSSRLGAQPSKPPCRLAFFRQLVLAWPRCTQVSTNLTASRHRPLPCAGPAVLALVWLRHARRTAHAPRSSGQCRGTKPYSGSAPSVRSLCGARMFFGVTAPGSSRGRQAVRSLPPCFRPLPRENAALPPCALSTRRLARRLSPNGASRTRPNSRVTVLRRPAPGRPAGHSTPPGNPAQARTYFHGFVR